jgi:2-iminobutanoate/2-iminopropanoate deaminase
MPMRGAAATEAVRHLQDSVTPYIRLYLGAYARAEMPGFEHRTLLRTIEVGNAGCSESIMRERRHVGRQGCGRVRQSAVETCQRWGDRMSSSRPAKGAPGVRRRSLNPDTVAPPIRSYYSNCVRVTAGSMLYISGQIGVDRSGKLIGPGAAEQAEQALRNIELILATHSATMRDVVKVTVFVTNIDDLDVIAPARMKYFPDNGPASAIVEVRRLAMGAKVEIEAIAAIEA